MKTRPHLNVTYISERLQEALCDIFQYSVTTVTAPMGYGKTTAVSAFLKQAEKDGILIRRQSIYSSSTSSFWKGFCRLFSGTAVYEEQTALPFPVDENSRGFFLELLDQGFQTDDAPVCFFIDDLHLLSEPSVFALLLALARLSLPGLHLILASRNPVFSPSEKLLLGKNLLEIDAGILSLRPEELKNYCSLCDLKLDTSSLSTLHHLTEGWFSCVYLNLTAYLSEGRFIEDNASIYDMIFHILLDPLPADHRKLLTILGLADEFTGSQAVYLWGDDRARDMLKTLTENNAFISRLTEPDTFRCHHMLKSCTRKMFAQLPPAEQNRYRARMGKWYQSRGYYEDAIHWLSLSDDYEALLAAVEENRGYALNIQHQEEVLRWLEQCPKEILARHSYALLIFMRRLYTFRRIPEMLQLKEFFLQSVSENPSLSEEERGNLLGECEVILSFLSYNDIQGMSLHHRKALDLMTKKTTSVGGSGSWTFGSPSVLTMYYRTPGSLDRVVADMKECMPYYYRLTDGHGSGAEDLTEAESLFLQGNFAAVSLPLKRAELAALEKKQWGMLLCKDFLEMRLALFSGDRERIRERMEAQKKTLKRELQSMFLNTLDVCSAFLSAILGCKDKIPEWIASGRLDSALVLHPATPMLFMTYGEVLLAEEDYSRLIAMEQELRRRFSIYPNLLCTLYLEIQLAGAFHQLGDNDKALSHLQAAFVIGEEDRLAVPFAENAAWIRPLLGQILSMAHRPFIEQILKLADELEDTMLAKAEDTQRPEGFTDNEWTVARFAASRLSNREIAEEMGFSEGTVKQYLNRIYGKLHLDGDARNKRRRLEELLKQSPPAAVSKLP